MIQHQNSIFCKVVFYTDKGTAKGERKNDNRDNIPLASNSPASGEGT